MFLFPCTLCSITYVSDKVTSNRLIIFYLNVMKKNFWSCINVFTMLPSFWRERGKHLDLFLLLLFHKPSIGLCTPLCLSSCSKWWTLLLTFPSIGLLESSEKHSSSFSVVPKMLEGSEKCWNFPVLFVKNLYTVLNLINLIIQIKPYEIK